MPPKSKIGIGKIDRVKDQRNTSSVRPHHQTQLILAPSSETPVTLDRSFELVRTVITAAISNITWIRDVFPNECYEVLNYDSSDPDASYDTFIKGTGLLHKKPGNFSWRVLARGTDGGVDKFLNWLENGVKVALEKKYLASLQLSFYEGKNVSADKLFEAYTLSITYTGNDTSVQFSTKGKDSDGKEIMLLDAKEGIRRLINSNIVTTQDMNDMAPSLPDERVANMQLTYTDTCPQTWNAPGFKSCTDPNLVVGHSEPKGRRVESMDTGHHSVRITLFNRNLAGGRPLDATGNHADKVVDATDKSWQPAIFTPISRRREISQSSEVDYQPTQESVVNVFKSIGTSRDLNGATQDTQRLEDSPLRQPNANGSTPPAQYINSRFSYTQPIMDRIKQARIEKQAVYSANDHVIDELLQPGPRVACECGASTDESNIIQCNVCDRFQHVQCYGYLGDCPPAEFVCYTCLLVGSEKTLLTQMRVLCVKRRALCFLRDKGVLENVVDLAEYLNRDEISTSNIVDQLKSHGLVIKVKKNGLRGKGKAGTPMFTYVNNEAKLQHDFFHPRLNIEHHFKLPQDLSLGKTETIEYFDLQPVQTGQQDSLPFPRTLPPTQTREARKAISALKPFYLDDSSTVGTPSPRVATGHVSASLPETPIGSIQTDKSDASQEMKELYTTGVKRGVQSDVDHSVKRVKASIANSPWPFTRN